MKTLSTVRLEPPEFDRPKIWIEMFDNTEVDKGIWIHLFKYHPKDNDEINQCFGPLELTDLQALQQCVNEAVKNLLQQEVADYKK